MASKAEMNPSTEPKRLATVEEWEPLVQSATMQEIRNRAYEIYLKRGAQSGHELEDWLHAERELKRD